MRPLSIQEFGIYGFIKALTEKPMKVYSLEYLPVDFSVTAHWVYYKGEEDYLFPLQSQLHAGGMFHYLQDVLTLYK